MSSTEESDKKETPSSEVFEDESLAAQGLEKETSMTVEEQRIALTRDASNNSNSNGTLQTQDLRALARELDEQDQQAKAVAAGTASSTSDRRVSDTKGQRRNSGLRRNSVNTSRRSSSNSIASISTAGSVRVAGLRRNSIVRRSQSDSTDASMAADTTGTPADTTLPASAIPEEKRGLQRLSISSRRSQTDAMTRNANMVANSMPASMHSDTKNGLRRNSANRRGPSISVPGASNVVPENTLPPRTNSTGKHGLRRNSANRRRRSRQDSVEGVGAFAADHAIDNDASQEKIRQVYNDELTMDLVKERSQELQQPGAFAHRAVPHPASDRWYNEDNSEGNNNDAVTPFESSDIESSNVNNINNASVLDIEGQDFVPVAQHVGELEVTQQARPFESEKGETAHNNNSWRRHLVMLVVVGLLLTVLGCIPLLMSLLQNNDSGSSSSSISPPNNEQDTLEPVVDSLEYLLLDNIPVSTLFALQNQDSPQAKAYQWLTEDSPEQYSQQQRWQRFILTTLYYAFQGPGWQTSTNWLHHNISECLWSTWQGGARCNNENAVIDQLLLFKNKLQGSIPPELGLLTDLTRLHLGDNLLTGTVPTQLGQLTQMLEMDLRAVTQDYQKDASIVSLEGTIPSELGLLTKLIGFGIPFHYYLSGTLPTELGQLSKLKEFYVLDTGVEGSIPSEFGQWTDMIILRLENNHLEGSVPSELGQLTHLKKLHLDSNRANATAGLSQRLPTELGQLTELVQLALFQNQFYGPLPSELWRLTNLQSFSIQDNRLTGTLSSDIGALTKLQWLAAGQNSFQGTLPSQLGKLSVLQQAWLEENDFSGTIPTELMEVDLNVLVLSSNKLSGNLAAIDRSIPREYWNLEVEGQAPLVHGECLPSLASPCHAYVTSCACGNIAMEYEPLWLDHGFA